MADTVRILLISGSLRGESTNTAVLRTAARVAGAGIVTELYDGVGDLPHFNPDDDEHPLPTAVAELRDRIHRADALLFSTPEYAGALPGAFKNLLDWTIGDDQPGAIYEKPVAWLNASSREARHAHDSLRLVLEYAHAAIVDMACAHVPVTTADIGDDGLIAPPDLRRRIADVVTSLATHVRAATGGPPA